MAGDKDRVRCRERIERLCESRVDRESLQQQALAQLQPVIGFDRWCWPVSDPQTLVPLGAGVAQHDYGQRVGRVPELEYSGGDFATMNVTAARLNPNSVKALRLCNHAGRCGQACRLRTQLPLA